MKITQAIVAAAFLFVTGCETTGNTTGSGSASSSINAETSSASAGISTSGTSNPAATSMNARGTLTEAATSTGTGTTNVTTSSSTTAPAMSSDGTTSSANSVNASTIQSAGNTIPPTNSPVNSGATASSFAVPSSHQTIFSTRYPQASNVQWSRYSSTEVPIDWDLTDWAPLDDNDYGVRYNVGSDPYYSWYDSEGVWIGTSVAMKNTLGLPSAVSTMLASKYKGYTISSAYTEYWKDKTAYEIEMNNSITKVKLLVDGNGNILKEKTKAQ